MRLLLLLSLVALIAAACGGNGGGDSSDPGDGDDVKTDGTTAEAAKPVPGGRMVFGMEADSDGFDPTKNRFAIAGHLVASSVYDPLTVVEGGQWKPHLAESVTPNADFSEWTIKLRSNIKFHDGTPLTSEAVKLTLDGHLKSFLTQKALSPIASVTNTDPLTTVVKLKQPWVPFPTYLTGQTGYIAAPATLNAADGASKPIGTGPFVFKEWNPGQKWVGTKNPNYWKKDAAGAQLPYLDEIEFRVITDAQARASALKGGDIDAMHTTRDEDVVDLRKEKTKFKLYEDASGEENFIMLNTAIEPFNNANARLALALATDQQKIIDVLGSGILHPVYSPFSHKDDLGFVADHGYPKYDLVKAKAAVAAYEKETGKKLSFKYGGTPSPDGTANQQFVQAMWKEAGIDAQIENVEQSQYILKALQGQYQAYGWRQFGAQDPDQDSVWWRSENALAIGELSLNFARNKDPQIDANLEKGRTSQDKAARQEAYAAVAKQLNKDLPYIWTSNTLWVVATNTKVNGLGPWLRSGGGGSNNGLVLANAAWITK